ncbi:hypothetical protein ACQ4LE_009110 [Meloidogyne hapla]|uniref:Proteasome subunit alpha type-3 n=1 Tax=Meloidogyne hapla TaxID=6305 RepID=A0A1I8BLN6_MELHA
MSSIGTGYDLAAASFSPDGRIFQVQYGAKAVESSVAVIALSSKKGVVVAVDQPILSKLEIEGANSRIMKINNKIGFVGSGLFPDVFALCNFAREEALGHFKQLDKHLAVKKLAERVAMNAHIYTLGISRPFGASVFITSWDQKEGSSIYCIETSGQCYKYYGWAIGKNAQAAKSEIEKIRGIGQTCEYGKEELIKRAIHVLLTTREEGTSEHRIEIGWIGEDSNEVFEVINQSEVNKLEKVVAKQMDEEDDI